MWEWKIDTSENLELKAKVEKLEALNAELLEELERLRDVFDNRGEVEMVDDISAAIAKAKGE